MSKKNLAARVARYEDMLKNRSVMGRRIPAVDPRAFHKPGSNKR